MKKSFRNALAVVALGLGSVSAAQAASVGPIDITSYPFFTGYATPAGVGINQVQDLVNPAKWYDWIGLNVTKPAASSSVALTADVTSADPAAALCCLSLWDSTQTVLIDADLTKPFQVSSLLTGLAPGVNSFFLRVGGPLNAGFGGTVYANAVPLPPAALLFGSVLAGGAFFRGRQKKQALTA